MKDELRIDVPLPTDPDDCYAYIVAYVFTISRDGDINITIKYSEFDEIWSDERGLTVPRHIWDQALPWLQERLAK